MSGRKIAEEQLFTSNAPIPRRALADDSPLRKVSGQYVDDNPLTPWNLWALAPLELERSWSPLADGTEAVWLVRNQKLRMALVDYRTNKILAWRLTAGSEAYKARPRRSRT